MLDKPRFLLHAEGFAVLTVSFAAYHQLNGSWLLFFLFLLWPDLLMLGYLANVRLGLRSRIPIVCLKSQI
jgi:hypothetical protein